MKSHVEFIPVAEVVADFARPLVGFAQQDAVGVALVHEAAHFFEKGVCFRKVFAVTAVAFEEIGYCVGAEAVHAQVEPELHHVQHLGAYGRVVEIQIGLGGIEAVPVMLTGDRVPGPVRAFGVHKDDAGVAILLVGVAPNVIIPKWGIPVGAGRLKPGVLVGGVIQHEVHDDAQPACVSRIEQGFEIVQRPIIRMDVMIIRNIIAIVLERGGVDGHQPETIHAEI